MITKPKDIGLMSAFTALLIVIKKTQQAEKSTVEALENSQDVVNQLQIQNDRVADLEVKQDNRVEEVMQLVNQRCDRLEQKLQELINDSPSHQVIEFPKSPKSKIKLVTFTEAELENTLVTLVADLCASSKTGNVPFSILAGYFLRTYGQSLSSVLQELKLGKKPVNFLKKRLNKFQVVCHNQVDFISLVPSVKELKVA